MTLNSDIRLKYLIYNLIITLIYFNWSCEKRTDTLVLAFYDDAQNTIWELHYDRKRKIYVDIIDPKTNNKINHISVADTMDLDYNMSFKITKQNDNIVLIGFGETPIFNVYNPITFKKTKGMAELETMDPKLDSTIIRMELDSPNSLFFNDIILEFITTYPDRQFYNVQKELYYNNIDELKAYITKVDEEMIPVQLITYILVQPDNDNDVSQLYKLTSRDKNKAYYFAMHAGSNDNTIKDFNYYKKRDCDKCQLTKLNDQKFTNTVIAYCDTSIVVLVTNDYVNSPDLETIRAYDSKGVNLFEISQFDYPNLETRTKSKDLTRIASEYIYLQDKNQLIIHFGKFGALCMNLSTGKTDWKYEPEVLYVEPESLRGK